MKYMKNVLIDNVIAVTRKCASTFLGEETIEYTIPIIVKTKETPKNADRM
jgi:hypothetical protein